MPFNISIVNALPDVREFVSPQFKQLIYSHLTYLRSLYRTQVITATPHQGLIWRGDFYGLLNFLGISKTMHWAVGAINGIDDSSDYDGTLLTFIVPSERDIMLLLARDNTIDSEPR